MSYDFLFGVPSKLAAIKTSSETLLARLTAVRAAYLDAAISTRAPATTALSKAQWTNSRAALLDLLTSIDSEVGQIRNAVATSPVSYQGYDGSILASSVASIGTCIANLHGQRVLVSHNTADSIWTPVIDISGSGVIDFMGITAAVHQPSTDMGVRVTVDNALMFNSASATDNLGGWFGSTNQTGYGILLNAIADNNPSTTFNSLCCFPLPFSLNFKVEMYIETGAASQGAVYGKYRTF